MECIKIKFLFKETLLHLANKDRTTILNLLEDKIQPHVLKMKYDSNTKLWNCAINIVDNHIENDNIKSIAKFLDQHLKAFDIKIIGRNLIWR